MKKFLRILFSILFAMAAVKGLIEALKMWSLDPFLNAIICSIISFFIFPRRKNFRRKTGFTQVPVKHFDEDSFYYDEEPFDADSNSDNFDNNYAPYKINSDNTLPTTVEEYRQLRECEVQEQCRTLIEYENVHSFDAYYSRGCIFFSWGSKYRLLAIDCFERCLEYEESREVYDSLGKLYERDHRFKKAIDMYKKALEFAPQFPGSYIDISRCLSKQNNLDSAILFLENVKSTQYYINPEKFSHFDTCIDRNLEKYIDKKNKGYIFKPKKLEFDYIEPRTMEIEEICSTYLSMWQPELSDEIKKRIETLL